jgi:hypothetical protein
LIQQVPALSEQLPAEDQANKASTKYTAQKFHEMVVVRSLNLLAALAAVKDANQVEAQALAVD